MKREEERERDEAREKERRDKEEKERAERLQQEQERAKKESARRASASNGFSAERLLASDGYAPAHEPLDLKCYDDRTRRQHVNGSERLADDTARVSAHGNRFSTSVTLPNNSRQVFM